MTKFTRKFSLFALIMALLCGASQTATAQDFPNLSVSHMWANELAFQNNFYNWAWHRSCELARQIPNDQPLPFDAMSISRSLNEGNQAVTNYIHHSQNLSERQLRAVEDYSQQAIRGNSPYSNQWNPTPVYLPYGPDAYVPMYDGVGPSQNVYMPMYSPYMPSYGPLYW